MAQKVTVELEDDLTGGPAEQTVRFAFEGTDYEIDLSAKNAAAFGKKLAPYLEHARRAGRAPARSPGGPRRTGSARVISGPGPRSTAWPLVNAGASRPAWWSNIRLLAGASTARRQACAGTAQIAPNALTIVSLRGIHSVAGSAADECVCRAQESTHNHASEAVRTVRIPRREGDCGPPVGRQISARLPACAAIFMPACTSRTRSRGGSGSQ